jgi:hypothetical protein
VTTYLSNQNANIKPSRFNAFLLMLLVIIYRIQEHHREFKYSIKEESEDPNSGDTPKLTQGVQCYWG